MTGGERHEGAGLRRGRQIIARTPDYTMPNWQALKAQMPDWETVREQYRKV